MKKKIELPPDFNIDDYIGTRRKIPQEVVEAIFGTPEEFHRGMMEFRCQLDLIRSEAMAARYPGEYVAVYGKEVVDHDPDGLILRARTDLLEVDQERLTIARAGGTVPTTPSR